MDSHEDMAGAEWETVEVEQELHDYPEWAEDSDDEADKPNIASRLENVDDSDSDDGFNVLPVSKLELTTTPSLRNKNWPRGKRLTWTARCSKK